MRINDKGYLVKRRNNTNAFLVKHVSSSYGFYVGTLCFPKKYLGKSVRIKLIIEEVQK